MDQILLYSTVVSSIMVALYSLIYIVNGSDTTVQYRLYSSKMVASYKFNIANGSDTAVQYSGTGCIVV